MHPADAIDQVIDGLERAAAGFRALRTVLSEDDEPEFEFDPRDPANKQEIGGVLKLTDQGEEICYRLFEAGKSRYAVSQLMGISYGAATHRYHAWEKAGGQNRQRRPLTREGDAAKSDSELESEFARQIVVAREVMQRRFKALRELAK